MVELKDRLLIFYEDSLLSVILLQINKEVEKIRLKRNSNKMVPPARIKRDWKVLLCFKEEYSILYLRSIGLALMRAIT